MEEERRREERREERSEERGGGRGEGEGFVLRWANALSLSSEESARRPWTRCLILQKTSSTRLPTAKQTLLLPPALPLALHFALPSALPFFVLLPSLLYPPSSEESGNGSTVCELSTTPDEGKPTLGLDDWTGTEHFEEPEMCNPLASPRSDATVTAVPVSVPVQSSNPYTFRVLRSVRGRRCCDENETSAKRWG
jgi:hypothetical protein